MSPINTTLRTRYVTLIQRKTTNFAKIIITGLQKIKPYKTKQ